MKKSTDTSGVILLQKVYDVKVAWAHVLRKSSTPAERVLWKYLRGNKIAGVKFRRQQIIEGFIVDFFCHKAKLVVEVDGRVHDTAEQKQIDTYRRKVFVDRGLREIRFRNESVLNDIKSVVREITAVVSERIHLDTVFNQLDER